jgi:single-stranded-DNA-specific exonuclease
MDFRKAVDKVKDAKKVLIVSHYDCDGICSAKIVSDALKRAGKKTEVMIAKDVSPELISKVEKNPADLIIFSDLGSGYLSLMPRDRPVIILDHHEQEETDVPENATQVNPCTEGKTLCGSGVCYLFSKKLSGNNHDLIDYAIVGAIGDSQIDEGENKKIVEEAKKLGRLRSEKGLNIFGHVNRPLSSSIKNSNHIPLNSESEIIQFFSNIDICLNENGRIKCYCDLGDEEKEKLKTELFKEVLRMDVPEPTKIFSNIYLLTRKPKKIMDAQELSTTLNAFGRLERFDDVFDMLDGKFEKIDEVMLEYRQRISSYLSWVGRNMENFESDENALYIDAGENIHENMIGTIVSMSLKGGSGKKIIVGLAQGKDSIKVSARSTNDKVNLDEILSRICEECGGYGGGHVQAAGGKIELGRSKEFIEKLQKDLKSHIA